MQQALTYSDIVLIPRYSELSSRSEADPSIEWCGRKFRIGVMPANMASVINEDICKWLAFNNYFYIFHRFSDTRKFLQRARAESWPLISISVGVKPQDKELVEDIRNSKCRVDFVCLDIAHSYSKDAGEMIKFLRENLPNTKVIAGNIWGDKDSVEFLQNAGAQAIKVGLSYGKACRTYNETGFGSPMFSAALQAGKWAKVPTILDGGLRECGDFAKAWVGFTSVQGEIAYGNRYGKVYSDPLNIPMLMAGSMFAGCIDSPGENVFEKPSAEKLEYESRMMVAANKAGLVYFGNSTKPKITHKLYYGSASEENKRKTGQEVKHIEGQTLKLECNGRTYQEQLEFMEQNIRSSISYGGGVDMTCFKDVQYLVK